MSFATAFEFEVSFFSETLGPALFEAGSQVVADVQGLIDAYRPWLQALVASSGEHYMHTTSVVGEWLFELGLKQPYAKFAVHTLATLLIALVLRLLLRRVFRALRWFLFPQAAQSENTFPEDSFEEAPSRLAPLTNLPGLRLRPAVGAAIPEVSIEEEREAAKQGLEFVTKGVWRGQLATPLSSSEYELRFDSVRRAYIAHVDSPGRLANGRFAACWGGSRGLNWHPENRAAQTATSVVAFHAAFLAFVRAKCDEHGVSVTGPLVQRRRWAS